MVTSKLKYDYTSDCLSAVLYTLLYVITNQKNIIFLYGRKFSTIIWWIHFESTYF